MNPSRPPRALLLPGLVLLVAAGLWLTRRSHSDAPDALPARDSSTPADASVPAPPAVDPAPQLNRGQRAAAVVGTRAAAGATGDRQLDVLILDGAGHPRAGALVRLIPAGDAPGPWTATDGDGLASLTPPPGPFQVGASASGQPRRQLAVAPLDAGERRALRFVLDSPAVMLVGLALDPAGQPLAARWLDLTLRGDGRGALPSRRRARTDTDGGFEFELEPRHAGLPLVRPLLELMDELGRRDRLSAALPGITPRLGENQLGKLVLAPTPLLLAGRLTGDADTVAGVEFVIERLDPEHGWQRVPDLGVYPGADPHFELRGRAEPGALRLSVIAPGFLPQAPIEVARGQRGLELELIRGGSLRARVLCIRPVEAELIPESGSGVATGIRLRRQGGHPTGRILGLEPGVQELLFSWSSLPEGTYRLVLMRQRNELLELNGLKIELDELCQDPRLNPIELADR